MKKRLLSLFLALAMVLTMVPTELHAKAATTPYIGCSQVAQPTVSDVRLTFDTFKYAETDMNVCYVDANGNVTKLTFGELSVTNNGVVNVYANNSSDTVICLETLGWGTETISYAAPDGQTYTMDIVSHIHCPGYYSSTNATQENWVRDVTVTKTDGSEVLYFIANPNNTSETLSGWTPTSDLEDIADVKLSTDNKCYSITFTGLPEDGKTYGFEMIDSNTQQSVANDYITLYDGVSGSGSGTFSDYDQITGDVYSITYDSSTGVFTISGLTQEFDTTHGTGVNLAFYSGAGWFLNDVWISDYQYVRDTNGAVTGITFKASDLSNVGAAISGNAYNLALAQFIQTSPVTEIRNKLTQSTPITFDIPAGNAGGNTGGTVQEVNVQIETDYGQITITNSNNNETDTTNHFGTGINVGTSLRQSGFTITDAVCEAGKRTFKYWNLYANTDSGSVDLQQKMTTQQILDYEVTADHENIIFVAQYDQDKEDFGSDISLFAHGGTFVVNHNVNNTTDDSDKETVELWNTFVWDGASIKTQETSFAVVSNPVLANHTFEGWLEFSPAGLESVDSNGKYFVYTTEQVLAKTIPSYEVQFEAKWAEISIDDYTNPGGGSSGDPNQDVYYEGMNYYEGHAYVLAGEDLKIKIINNLVPTMTNIVWRVGVGLGDANPILFTPDKDYTIDANDSAKITLHGAALQDTLAALNTDAFTVEVSSDEGFTYEHTVFLKDENDLGGEEDPEEGPSVSGDDITIEANGHTHHTFDHGTTQSVIIAVTANSQSDAALTYQWYCNGQKIDGATKAEYEIVDATADAVYYCVVSNGSETLQSMDFNIVFTVNVQFQGNGGQFEFVAGDDAEMVGDTGFGKRIGKTLLEEGFSVTDPVWPDGSRNFLGWNMIGVMDSQGGNLIAEKVTTEYALEYVITDKYPTIVFEAQWDGEDPGQGGGESGIPEGYVLVVFEGNDGEITVTDGTNSESFGYTETYAEPGYCFADEGISILDPVFWDPDRAFVGWLVFVGETITDEDGNESIEWNSVNDDALLTSQQLANYEFTDKNTMFQAQWEGSDDDYYTSVWLDLYGGLADFDWGNWTETSDNWGSRFRKNSSYVGTTLYKQLGDFLVGDPYYGENQFEGWLIKDDQWNFINGDKNLYTTDQIWGKTPVGTDDNGNDIYLTIRENNIIYQAKWSHIPFSVYDVQVNVEDTPEVDLGGITAGVESEATKEALSNAATEVVNVVADIVTGNADAWDLETLKQIVSEEVVDEIHNALESGKDLTVNTIVSIEPIDDQNTDSDVKEDVEALKNLVEDAEGVIAQFLDLNVLLETYLDGAETPSATGKITELPEPIVIVLTIPENLPDVSEGYERQFVVIYRHNGILKDIGVDVDEENGLIFFPADEFSTYALAYKDVATSGQGGNPTPQPTPQPQAPSQPQGPAQSAGNAPTGDTAPVMLYMGLLMVAVILMAVAETKRRALKR